MFTRTARNVSAGATALLLALALSACGGGSETETTTAAEGEALVNAVEEEAQAKGAFDAAVVTPDKTLLQSHLQENSLQENLLQGNCQDKLISVLMFLSVTDLVQILILQLSLLKEVHRQVSA